MHELSLKDCVVLDGPLTVRTVADIRTRILAALRQQSFVSIDAGAATEVDLSFIQLVLSARKSAAAQAKTVSLARPADGILRERLLQAGLMAAAGAAPVTDQAFWSKTETADGENNSHRG